jgi:hypothetical protein
MSILEVLEDHLANQRLVLIDPILPGAVRERFVYASPEILAQLEPDTADADGAGELRSWLDQFSNGKEIVVGSRRSRDADMKRLELCDEIWEVRKRDTPSTRVFGRFVAKNHLLLTNIRLVTDLFAYEWTTKRGFTIWPIWRQEIRNCASRWRQFFPTYDPHRGEDPSDYISRARKESSF